MPRSNRRQGRSYSRQNNPQSRENRVSGFEQTGTGYRYDDQQGRFGQQSRGSGSRNWPGQEQWRDPSERSRSEGRDYGSGYERESRFGRGGYEGTRSFGQGSPERERGWNREDEFRYRPGSEAYGYGAGEYGSEGEYEGYEPGDYSWSTGERSSRFGSGQRFGGYSGSTSQGTSFGQRSTDPGWSGPFAGEQSRFGQQGRMRDFGITGQWGERQGQRSFAGRGPQGYKRSDERITEDINEELTQDEHLDASNITVEVRDGEVTLRGTVSDREAKRRAEDLAESCSGVKEVQNQLRVKREDGSESESKREKGDEKQQRSSRQQIAS